MQEKLVEKANKDMKRKRLFVSVVIVAVLYLFFSITGSLYVYSDNMTVSIVTSGMYGKHFICQYLHPLFCTIIRILTPVLPTADVFTTLVHLALIFGVLLMFLVGIELVLPKGQKKWDVVDYIRAALLLLSMFFYCIGMNLWGLNYTVQAAAILFSGIVILSYARWRKKGRFWIISGTLLMTMGFLMRSETAMLFIPFIGLEVLSGFVGRNHRQDQIRDTLKFLGPSIIICALLLISGEIFWSIEPYAFDSKYNEYRTIVEDYPMHAYVASRGEAVGIDELTYNVVQDWGLFDTDHINAETLQKIAEIGSRNEYGYTGEGMKHALKDMLKRILHMDIHFLVLVIVSLLLTVRNIIATKSKWLKLETILALIGSFFILLYFTFRGRALLRVWQCVFLALDSILLSVIIRDSVTRENESGGWKGTSAGNSFFYYCYAFACILA